jgi:GNAT superfamily N-acetyltransferase
MGRRIAPVTADVLGQLPWPCRECAFWETAPWQREPATAADAAATKAAWLERTATEWGVCGQVAYVDDVLAGYVTYAPPAFVPRSAAFPTAPVGPDAVLLVTSRVSAAYRGSGLGRVLVQSAAKDLTRRGVRAIEAYGALEEGCVLPVDYLESVGFVTVRDHARSPRLRLDLRTALAWREPVGEALGRIRGAVRPFPAGANRG